MLDELTGFENTAIPSAGKWSVGPDDTYPAPPLFSKNISENKLIWTFGNNNNNEQNTTLDILFTVTASHRPMADNLHLTNIATSGYKSASGDPHGDSGFQEVVTQTPQLVIDKNIVHTTNNGQGQALPTKMLDKVDAGDTITYEIHLENTGHAPAYDIICDRYLDAR